MDYNLRSEQGEGYYTIISDDVIVHWEPLSIGDFIKYEFLFKSNSVPVSILEDEIFSKCVLDKEYIKERDYLPAGTVSTVVQNIFTYSGPGNSEEFNNFLEYNRQLSLLPLHMIVPLIVRAFPSYKPEDLYNMKYEVFMLRLAQAEALLLKLNIINEPISIINQEKPEPKKQKISKEDMRSIKEHWENKDKPTDSPIFNEGKIKVQKGLDKERVAIERQVGEPESPERTQMLKDAAIIYKDTLSKLPHYNKNKKEG